LALLLLRELNLLVVTDLAHHFTHVLIGRVQQVGEAAMLFGVNQSAIPEVVRRK
jgi:hypothetical protein